MSNEKVQKLLQSKFAKEWMKLDDIIAKIVEIATNGTAPNPVTGDLQESHKVQMDAIKFAMKIMWLDWSKKKELTPFNLFTLIYPNATKWM